MTTCVGAGRQTEFEYIVSLRGREPGTCRGPLLGIVIGPRRLEILERAVPEAHDLLWDSFEPYLDQMFFVLCAGHWMDLAYFCGLRARQNRNGEWFAEANALLDQMFAEARWDPKEISNMVTWQRVQLT